MPLKILTLMFITLLAAGCGRKSPDDNATETEADTTAAAGEWAMMDEFHWVMAESFHPYMDSGNLEPARRLAPEMAATAAKWAEAPVPPKLAGGEVEHLLDDFRKDTDAFAALVNNKSSDDTLGAVLTRIHDRFHALEEAWYTGGQEHDEHSH